jgi:predicted metalloprotease with PDZ domain
VNAGDELIALNGFRVSATGLPARLAEQRPGDPAHLTVFRRDELLTLEVVPEHAVSRPLRLERTAGPSALQEATYQSWLYLDPAAATR